MNYTASATTTDRDAERFHVVAPDPETGLRRAESHLRRSVGWTRDDVARSVIHVVPSTDT